MRVIVMWAALTLLACGTDAPKQPTPLAEPPDAETPTPDVPDEEDPPEVDSAVEPEGLPEGSEASHQSASGGSTLIYAPEGDSLHLIDRDRGSLVTLGLDGELLHEVLLGSRPSRMIRHQNRIWVTVAGEGLVVAFEEAPNGTLTEVLRRAIGGEPRDLVAPEDGDIVYVAVGLTRELIALSSTTLEVLQRWVLWEEPRWLVHGDAEVLVFAPFGDRFWRVTPDDGRMYPTSLPTLRFRGSCGGTPYSARVSGAPDVTTDGSAYAIPVLYADHETLVVETPEEEATCHQRGYASPPPPPEDPPDPGRFISVVATWNGANRWTKVAAMPPAAPGSSLEGVLARSPIHEVRFSPDDALIVASMEVSHHLIAIDADRAFDRSIETAPFHTSPGIDTLVGTGTVALETAYGPRGLAFSPDGDVLTETWIGRQVQLADLAPIAEAVVAMRDIEAVEQPSSSSAIASSIALPDSPLTPDLQLGRRLFHDATDPRLVVPGGGLTCATCHVEGRSDGLVWELESGPRQTPALLAGLEHTMPLTWTLDVMSIPEEIQRTLTLRLGGTGLPPEDIDAMTAFIESFPPPHTTPFDGDLGAVDRGRLVFDDPASGCAACHPAPLYTDNLRHTLYGVTDVNTPTLIGLSATAPYLHDGRYLTIRNLVDDISDGPMGNGTGWTAADRDDLQAFLSSL